MCEFLDGNEDINTHGAKLPHWQQDEVMQFVTFRLGDAMPTGKLSIWKQERDIWLRHHPEPWAYVILFCKTDETYIICL